MTHPYEKPFRAAWLRSHHPIAIAVGPGGRLEEHQHIIADKHGIAIEVDVRNGVVKFWSTRLADAPVTSAKLQAMSWHRVDEIVPRLLEIPPNGPRAA